jgi:ESS family glutamate:Na+ symporter
MFKLIDAFFAFTILSVLVLAGRAIRQKTPLFRSLYLPSSIVAGGLGLLLGPGILGALAKAVFGPDSPLANGVFSEQIRNIWSQSPSIFINVVFAALFLGETIPAPRDIWRKAAPQVAFGQSLAWGQYVVGLLLAIFILTPFFNLDPIAGALIEITFEGGHGTAAGMAQTFVDLGFPEGADLALGLATVGLLSGIIAGISLINWGRKKGHVQVNIQEEINDNIDFLSNNEHPDIRRARAVLMRDLLIDPLTLNLGFVGLAIIIGWLILQSLIFIESITWGQAGVKIMTFVPLFPIALIGGIIVQLIMKRLGLSLLIVRPLIERIGGVALDITIVTALATISLAAIGANLGAFVILSIAGIVWNIWTFLFLGPRLLPSYWFERGVGDMGQSMGVTSTGILLIKMVDPENRSGAFESFAYKQLFFEPIVGGGLFTAAAPPLIRQFGPIPILFLTAGLLAFWIIFGLYNFKRMTRT